MSKYTQDKNYIYYDNTNIPINKLNIRDLKILEEEERKLLLKGYEYFHEKLSEETVFDENYFRELHGKTFNKLYDFAGKYRNVNISKGYSTFCQVRFLEQTTKEDFTQKLAYYMCELIALHPFLELNGRIIRLFFDMIVTYNGYEYIDYQDALKMEEGENKYIKASIDCMTGYDNQIYQIILNALKKVK